MNNEVSNADIPLVASPYDLRVSLGAHVHKGDIRAALESGDYGFVHSFTTGSTVDGPGVRLVAWLTGCQFRCLYCHNPDTWRITNGMPVTVLRAVEVIQQYRHALRVMKGGLTLSGGEPMVQHRFVLKVFAAARDMGIHTALDTNGFLGDRLSDRDLQACDLVMLGLKALDPDLHRRITGMDNGPVLAFARRLAVLRKPMWLRYVLVPGLTDHAEEITRIAQFAADLGNVERVDVLAFHQLGRFKWENLGMDYELRATKPPSQAEIEEAVAGFRARGLKAF